MHASMWFSVRVLFQESLFLSCQSRELLILSTLTGGCTLESLWTPGYVAEPSLCVCVCVCVVLTPDCSLWCLQRHGKGIMTWPNKTVYVVSLRLVEIT